MTMILNELHCKYEPFLINCFYWYSFPLLIIGYLKPGLQIDAIKWVSTEKHQNESITKSVFKGQFI